MVQGPGLCGRLDPMGRESWGVPGEALHKGELKAWLSAGEGARGPQAQVCMAVPMSRQRVPHPMDSTMEAGLPDTSSRPDRCELFSSAAHSQKRPDQTQTSTRKNAFSHWI